MVSVHSGIIRISYFNVYLFLCIFQLIEVWDDFGNKIIVLAYSSTFSVGSFSNLLNFLYQSLKTSQSCDLNIFSRSML